MDMLPEELFLVHLLLYFESSHTERLDSVYCNRLNTAGPSVRIRHVYLSGRL